jgi:hypothetical protein
LNFHQVVAIHHDGSSEDEIHKGFFENEGEASHEADKLSWRYDHSVDIVVFRCEFGKDKPRTEVSRQTGQDQS